ncbi:hypothetical protein LJC68_05325 [Bacteroidales bacterium OttesenSCG-928-B11]|nr:hypothetical protein [Bacteroidales bacterium OttesenSCG-928-B11]MDL2326363.1 hypothetical protein [Bacteroidales bacterium OttesenSCG-928-A14]
MKIEHLIEKYLSAEITPDEERELETQLALLQEDEEFYEYKQLFRYFDDKKCEKCEELPAERWIGKLETTRKKNRKWLVLAGGIAASLLLVLSIVLNVEHRPKLEGYVVINGTRINDPVLAAKYVAECDAELQEMMRYSDSIIEKMEMMIEDTDNELSDWETANEEE